MPPCGKAMAAAAINERAKRYTCVYEGKTVTSKIIILKNTYKPRVHAADGKSN
jgi:hypothetical protein